MNRQCDKKQTPTNLDNKFLKRIKIFLFSKEEKSL